jgi:integrase/recombinase XerC
VDAYLNDVNEFLLFLQQHKITAQLVEVQPAEIKLWMMSMLENDLSARSVSRKLSSLRSYYKFLIRDGAIQASPLAAIKAPNSSKRLPVFASVTDVEKMFSDPLLQQTDFTGLRDRLILELLYGTGIRLAELVGIRNDDISDNMLRVRGKRNKERLLPLHPELLKIINAYNEERNNTFPDNKVQEMILSDNGKKIYRKLVYNKVNFYLGMFTSLSKKSPHIMRHTFATHMLNNGAELNSIKELLGHSGLTSTQVYTHNSFSRLKSIHQTKHPRGDKNRR